MYLKVNELNPVPTIVNDIEYVELGTIVTNYPETGEGWVAEYSTDEYITTATEPVGTIPPENEVDLAMSQYIFDYVNKYAGAERPA